MATIAEIDAAIARVLLNGEKWKTGDVESELSLEQLRLLRNEAVAAAATTGGTKLYGVQFQNPGGGASSGPCGCISE